MGRKSKAKFELKGHTLPGINQKSETSNLKDGKSPSSAFQMQSPMKETTMPSYGGVKIDPTLSYKYKSTLTASEACILATNIDLILLPYSLLTPINSKAVLPVIF